MSLGSTKNKVIIIGVHSFEELTEQIKKVANATQVSFEEINSALEASCLNYKSSSYNFEDLINDLKTNIAYEKPKSKFFTKPKNNFKKR